MNLQQFLSMQKKMRDETHAGKLLLQYIGLTAIFKTCDGPLHALIQDQLSETEMRLDIKQYIDIILASDERVEPVEVVPLDTLSDDEVKDLLDPTKEESLIGGMEELTNKMDQVNIHPDSETISEKMSRLTEEAEDKLSEPDSDEPEPGPQDD